MSITESIDKYEQFWIRAFNKNDENALLGLLQFNIPKYFAVAELVDFKEYLDKFREDYFVLCFENEVVACGGINYFEETARISWDIVHPSYQNKGIGSILLRYRLDKLKEQSSIKSIVVRTAQEVFQFYEKFGFELKEIVPNYWAMGYDLYLMERKNRE